MSSVIEIEADIKELKDLIEKSRRSNVKSVLQVQLQAMEIQLSETKKRTANMVNNKSTINEINNISSNIPLDAYIPISQYSWDQSDKKVRVYITMNNIHNNVDCLKVNFNDNSFDLQITNLNNKYYKLSIKLNGSIVESQSNFKVKTDMIVLTMTKQDISKWPQLSSKENHLKKATSPDTFNTNDSSDPMAGIQNLMKKMYEEGDDEMKRTIAKAWTEAQDKNISNKF
ncbi:CS domain-containing protein [Cryptosporidium andersoni]|uniref:Calcyclin-binding protein n=1 Tax=Cryptosporidium andersoni TaxID=117008 RepID=A0A1J4MRG6_9CRYT|nr:CS domain-containing protein [Cryptosporidium andersoni]